MPKDIDSQPPFSQQLEQWLKGSKNKDFEGLIKVFEEKSFAILFLLLMALPALPIPTGGLTHVTEFLTIIGALQLMAGRRTIWLPRWATRKVDVGKLMSGKGGRKLISVIKWFERWSKRRWSGLLVTKPILSLLGTIVLIYALAAALAVPFSGLDTLPALAVVTISLGMILEDSLIVLAGVLIGIAGIGVEIAIGGAAYKGVSHFF